AICQNSLRTLSLKVLRQSSLPTMRELHQILASSPLLESLILCDLPEVVEDKEFHPKPVRLAHLRCFEATNVEEQTLTGLAAFLRTETLKSLTVRVRARHGSVASDFTALLSPSLKNAILPSVIRNEGWKLISAKVLANTLELTGKSGGVGAAALCLSVGGVVGYELLELLGPRGRGYDVDLNISECALRGQNLDRVLRLIDPACLSIGADQIPPTMKALSMAPPPSERWFCPNLEEVHLLTPRQDLNKIAKSLRARNGLAESGPLEGRQRLTVYNMDGDVFSIKKVSFVKKGALRQSIHERQ
ncbi:hypothetical protein FRB90_006924, partial [Tulasnella sp. 427]